MKKILSGFIISTALFFAMSRAANALSIVNGSFESGDLTGWSIVYGKGGSASVKTGTNAYKGTPYSATDGSYFAEVIATAYISQDQSWNTGDHLTFDWAFLGFDYKPYNDYSVFEVKNEFGTILDAIKLSDISTVGNYGDTGWNTYTYIFSSDGSGSISFGSINYKDDKLDSKLLVDNLVTTPEPATMILLGIGIAGIGGRYLRRKRQAEE